MQHVEIIRAVLQRVRARWRMVRLLEGVTRAALAASAVLVLALLSARFIGTPLAFGITGLAAALAALAAVVWGLAPARITPSDKQVARFIEERAALDDQLASAVDLAASRQGPASPTFEEATFADAVLADAARRASRVDVEEVVPGHRLRRRALEAAAAGMLLLVVAFAARGLGRQTIDALALALFPSRVRLEVVPGDTHLQTGKPMVIRARLVGNRAPVVAQVRIADGTRWRTTDMTMDQAGEFHLGLDAVTSGFTYKVTAGSIASREYTVTVASPPHVARIDIDYTYPPALGLAPRTDEDSGDIYAPLGTDVRVRVHADRAIASGRLALADGQTVPLTETAAKEYTASFKLVDDNSYRVAMTDGEGLVNPGDTDYFIRTLEDRPPQVRVVKPAADRGVSPLEEVEIDAQADDDFGIARMELVYAVRGRGEKVVPMAVPGRATSVETRQTLFLEDLGVHSGDFVSYYVRAFDVARGKKSNEARSDIFFLDVRPFEQEFVVSQGQTGSAAKSVDDLVTAQKEVVVATWKLERRSENAKGAISEQDVQAVARAQAELKARVEETASAFRERTMRNPQAPPQAGGAAGPGTAAPRAGRTLPEEDAMTAASAAMGQAVTWLTALNTRDAVPPEMDALTSLLKAQGEVKRREVPKPQNGNASGNGPVETNTNYDMSALFDKELRRIQQTNYEDSAESQPKPRPVDEKASALDRIKDLARRQDELLKRQQELAKNKDAVGDEAAKREMEKLTREQSELRQRADDLAAQPGATGQSGQAMRQASEEMRNAAGDLRRQDPAQASARGSRALDKLREAERQMGSQGPDDRKRAIGDMQLEARQIADGQRRIADDVGKTNQGEKGQDAARRLAGEQENLAERTRRLQEELKGQAGEERRDGQAGQGGPEGKKASADAARGIEQQRLVERMQKSAADLRLSAGRQGGAPAEQPSVADQRAIARALDKAADELASAGEGGDPESRKLSEQLARTRELRERLDDLGNQLADQNGRGARDQAAGNPQGAQKTQGESGRSGEGQPGASTDPGKLSDELAQQLRETRELLDEVARQNPNGLQGSGGGTPIGPGMVMSAPGTEAFKQDFAKWDQLRRQATAALDQAEASLSTQLRAARAHDRLAAGVADTAPPEYQQQVDSYFKAIAGKKK